MWMKMHLCRYTHAFGDMNAFNNLLILLITIYERFWTVVVCRSYRLVHKCRRRRDVWMTNDGHAHCDHRIGNLKCTCMVQWHESIESSVSRGLTCHKAEWRRGDGQWIFKQIQCLGAVRWLVHSCCLVFSDLTGGGVAGSDGIIENMEQFYTVTIFRQQLN